MAGLFRGALTALAFVFPLALALACPALGQAETAPAPDAGMLTISLGPQFDGTWHDAGSVAQVNWTASGGTAPLVVKLEYMNYEIGGKNMLIRDGLPASGSYRWEIPWVISNSSWVKASVRDAAGKSASDLSSAAFKIVQSSIRGIVTGKVTDPSGMPVNGATVHLLDTDCMDTTDPSGLFNITAPPGGYTLEASAAGLDPYSKTIIVGGIGGPATYVDAKLLPENKLKAPVVAGLVLYFLANFFALMVFFQVYRRRKEAFLATLPRRRPVIRDIHAWDSEDDDVDQYWEEDGEDLSRPGKGGRQRKTEKQQGSKKK